MASRVCVLDRAGFTPFALTPRSHQFAVQPPPIRPSALIGGLIAYRGSFQLIAAAKENDLEGANDLEGEQGGGGGRAGDARREAVGGGRQEV